MSDVVKVDGYDSRVDTQRHIDRVRGLIGDLAWNMAYRAHDHDASKLVSPEVEAFDLLNDRLKGLVYGGDEYKATLRELKPALDHHYAHNSHHPEHYGNGIDGMSLLDLLEMLADWKAAGERHGDGGDIERSIRINIERFGISPQLASVLRNTVKEMNW